MPINTFLPYLLGVLCIITDRGTKWIPRIFEGSVTLSVRIGTAGNPFLECGMKMWAGCWICFPLILPTPNCSHRGQELLQTFEGSSPTRTHKLVEKNILNIEDEPYGHINCYNIIDSPMMQGWCKILGFIGNKYLGHDGIATLVIGHCKEFLGNEAFFICLFHRHACKNEFVPPIEVCLKETDRSKLVGIVIQTYFLEKNRQALATPFLA